MRPGFKRDSRGCQRCVCGTALDAHVSPPATKPSGRTGPVGLLRDPGSPRGGKTCARGSAGLAHRGPVPDALAHAARPPSAHAPAPQSRRSTGYSLAPPPPGDTPLRPRPPDLPSIPTPPLRQAARSDPAGSREPGAQGRGGALRSARRRPATPWLAAPALAAPWLAAGRGAVPPGRGWGRGSGAGRACAALGSAPLQVDGGRRGGCGRGRGRGARGGGGRRRRGEETSPWTRGARRPRRCAAGTEPKMSA